MKQAIHPTYYSDTIVTCACGNTFVTGSTKKTIHVEICGKCHPFYTGEQKFVDTLGTVDKFLKKQAAAKGYVPKKKQTSAAKPEFKSLKDMLDSKRPAPTN